MEDELGPCPKCDGSVMELVRDYEESIIEYQSCLHVWDVNELWCKNDALQAENKRLRDLLRRSLSNLQAQGSGGFVGILASEIEATLKEGK